MECPLCMTKHPMYVRGIIKNHETGTESLVEDRGYAFCNCRNIFYTDWSNIDQRIYDQDYFDKYQFEGIDELYNSYSAKYFPMFFKHGIKNFCEIGAINNTMLNTAKELGWDTLRLDINECSDEDGHKTIIGDIENPDIVRRLNQIDCFWMAHTVEHLKDPILTLKNVRECLSKDGLVFISMPDPFFVDWSAPSTWGHWALREHHILWDMDSFIELMEEIGFKLLHKQRNLAAKFICCLDYHLVFQKVAK